MPAVITLTILLLIVFIIKPYIIFVIQNENEQVFLIDDIAENEIENVQQV